MPLISRPRRNRRTPSIRELVSETKISVSDFIMPLFFKEGVAIKEEIKAMPGQYRFSIDLLLKEVGELVELGIQAVALFPAVNESLKSKDAKEAYNPNGINQKAIKAIKEQYPKLTIMTDVALDPYSSDGHDGLVDPKTGEILNDETLSVLAKMAVCQAEAGSDLIGPSDMMDGRVGVIREALDAAGYQSVGIISYTAKYASAFYGPFRDALSSAPKSGDKKSYQMNFTNSKEALREAELDIIEGADILMVKPGLSYLDVISKLSEHTHLPIAAYNVSGEYAMIKAAAERGWINEDQIILETLTAFKRAGCQIILTYFAKRAAQLLEA